MAKSTKFTQADVARALKGASAGGFSADTVEITALGSIRLTKGPGQAREADMTPFADWKTKYDARKAQRT